MISLFNCLASFTAPMEIGGNPASTLWMLPLAAAISVVYKAIKIPNLTTKAFVREAVQLFVSIVVFIVGAAIALSVIAYLATE